MYEVVRAIHLLRCDVHARSLLNNQCQPGRWSDKRAIDEHNVLRSTWRGEVWDKLGARHCRWLYAALYYNAPAHSLQTGVVYYRWICTVYSGSPCEQRAWKTTRVAGPAVDPAALRLDLRACDKPGIVPTSAVWRREGETVEPTISRSRFNR